MIRNIQPRIACYTHDAYGLGHVRRCLNILRLFARNNPHVSCLLITGSQALHFFNDLPPNIDFVKLPTLVKTGSSGSQPPHLRLGLPELTLWRSKIIRETILGFQPDLFLVDNFPLGSRSELLPLLQELRHYPTKTILGMRDIINSPELVKQEWKQKGVYQALDSYYDSILIYGVPEIFNALEAYQVPSEIRKKVHYCGYLTATDPVTKSPEDVRKELGIEGPFILATGGGGGDAYPLLSTFIETKSPLPEATKVIFMGPLMGEKDRLQLRQQAKGAQNTIMKDFVTDLRPYLLAADAVVTMCGYNIASEILYHRTRAVVTPRSWQFGEHRKRKQAMKDHEQIIRAQKLSEHGLIHYVDPDQLNPETLTQKISETLQKPISRNPINVQGLQNTVEHIQKMISGTVQKE